MEVDLGDVVASFNLRVKGRSKLHLRIRVGAPYDTGPEDRIVQGPPYHHPNNTERTGIAMDLQADKQVPLSAEWTDEVGNPVGTPADATFTYTVEDPTLINLTDNGDGTAVAAAVGALGATNVHLVATGAGQELHGDFPITVVAGLAERLNIVAGEPTEVTPD